MYVKFISASNNVLLKKVYKIFNTSQTTKTSLSYTILIYINTL